MKNNSLKKLVGIGLAIGTGICLTFPAFATNSTTESPEILAQGSPKDSPSSPAGAPSKPTGAPSKPADAPSKPADAPSPSTSSTTTSDEPGLGKHSQSIKDANSLPGGWLCLNSPNPKCIAQSQPK